MEVLYITIPLSLLLGLGFLILFIRAVKKGQFDNLEDKKTMIFEINSKQRMDDERKQS